VNFSRSTDKNLSAGNRLFFFAGGSSSMLVTLIFTNHFMRDERRKFVA
jgi:hypothetical protein